MKGLEIASLSNNGYLQSSRQDTAPHRLHHPCCRSNGPFRSTPLHERPTEDQSQHYCAWHGTSLDDTIHTCSTAELTKSQGAKSLIFIAYQISTEHVQALHRWQSFKAYWILNALETVFWGAVVFLVMQANLARCVGVGCKLSWAVMAVGIVLKYVSTPRLGVSSMLYRVSSADILVAFWHLTWRSFVSSTTAGDAISLTA